MISLYISLCRPSHAVKNLLILLPPFFGHAIVDSSIVGALPAVVSFSLIASAVYIVNDLMDCERDRRHPVKRERAIASGKVTKNCAIIFCITLLSAGFFLTIFASNPGGAALIAFIYFLINIAYSWRLKHFPVCDIFILAIGFVLRVYFGGLWFHIAISPWLFLCVLCGALCFATGKRRNELRHIGSASATRAVLRKYTYDFLNATYYLFCGITIVFFSLWVVLANRCGLMLLLSIPVVLLILLRYNLILETCESGGDPVPTLLKDKSLVMLILVFGVICFLGVYCS